MYFLIFCVLCILVCSQTNANFCGEKVTEPCRDNAKNCNKICDQSGCEIRAAVILPNDSSIAISSIPNVMPLLEKAISDAYELKILPHWINITLIPKDDQCDASYAQIATIESYSDQHCIHAIFGPVCDYCLATVSRIVKFFGTPLLTAGGFSNDFDKEKTNCEHEYYMLVRTGKLVFKGLSQFFKKISISYGWRKVAFLYDEQGQREVAGENTCSLMMKTMAQELKQVYGFQYKDGDLGLSTFSISDFLKKDIGVNYGIIVMCASRIRVHEILLAAAELEKMLDDGEYVFFNIELTSRAPDPDHPWIENNVSDWERTEKLKRAYKNVLTLTSLSEEVTYNNYSDIRKKSNYTSGFYDAMMLYLQSVKTFLKPGGQQENINTTINGYELVCKMYDVNFTGLNGEVQMNRNGDRRTHYSLLSYNPHRNKFDVVANYTKEDENFTFIDGKVIYWQSGLDTPPSDTPVCGYDNSKCEVLPPHIIGIIIGSIMIIIIGIAIFVYMNYRYNQLKKIENKHWRINGDTIQDLDKVERSSLLSLFNARKDQGIPTCNYKNNIVAVKKVPNVKLPFTTDQLIEINDLFTLQSEQHLVKFIGLYVDSPSNHYIFTEYCPKGSLQELLESNNADKIFAENMIQKSFIKDLMLGMSYLHQSEIKTHGALTSANCVVDNRLVLKISDYGLHFLYKRNERVKDDKFWKSQLWKAPELLRMENPPIQGTQKGDVYSFAIIVHEIIERKGPFYLGADYHLTPKGWYKFDFIMWRHSGQPLQHPTSTIIITFK